MELAIDFPVVRLHTGSHGDKKWSVSWESHWENKCRSFLSFLASTKKVEVSKTTWNHRSQEIGSNISRFIFTKEIKCKIYSTYVWTKQEPKVEWKWASTRDRARVWAQDKISGGPKVIEGRRTKSGKIPWLGSASMLDSRSRYPSKAEAGLGPLMPGGHDAKERPLQSGQQKRNEISNNWFCETGKILWRESGCLKGHLKWGRTKLHHGARKVFIQKSRSAVSSHNFVRNWRFGDLRLDMILLDIVRNSGLSFFAFFLDQFYIENWEVKVMMWRRWKHDGLCFQQFHIMQQHFIVFWFADRFGASQAALQCEGRFSRQFFCILG